MVPLNDGGWSCCKLCTVLGSHLYHDDDQAAEIPSPKKSQVIRYVKPNMFT